MNNNIINYAEVSFRDLQKLCKDRSITAKGSADALRAALVENDKQNAQLAQVPNNAPGIQGNGGQLPQVPINAPPGIQGNGLPLPQLPGNSLPQLSAAPRLPGDAAGVPIHLGDDGQRKRRRTDLPSDNNQVNLFDLDEEDLGPSDVEGRMRRMLAQNIELQRLEFAKLARQVVATSESSKFREARISAQGLFPPMQMEGRNSHEYETLAAVGQHVVVALAVNADPEVKKELDKALEGIKNRAFQVAAVNLTGCDFDTAASLKPTPSGSFLKDFSQELNEARKVGRNKQIQLHQRRPFPTSSPVAPSFSFSPPAPVASYQPPLQQPFQAQHFQQQLFQQHPFHQGNSHSSRPDIICFNCHAKGHVKTQCTLPPQFKPRYPRGATDSPSSSGGAGGGSA